MKRHSRLLCLCLLIGILLSLTACAAREPFAVHFLPIKGDLLISEHPTAVTALSFIARNPTAEAMDGFHQASRSAVLSAEGQFHTISNVELTDSGLTAYDSGQVYIYYRLSFALPEDLLSRLADLELAEALSVDGIYIEDVFYPLGQLMLRRAPVFAADEPLTLTRHMALVPNNAVDESHALFKNQSASAVRILSVNTGVFADASILWDRYSDSASTEGLPFPFQPQEEHRMEILLADDPKDGSLIHLIGAIITYEADGKQYFADAPTCISGVPGNKTRLLEMAKLLFALPQ